MEKGVQGREGGVRGWGAFKHARNNGCFSTHRPAFLCWSLCALRRTSGAVIAVIRVVIGMVIMLMVVVIIVATIVIARMMVILV